MNSDKILRRYIDQVNDAIKNGNQSEITRLLKREQDNQFRQDRYVPKSKDTGFKPPLSLNYLMSGSDGNKHEFTEIADKEMTAVADTNLRYQQELQTIKQIVNQAIEMLEKSIDRKIVRLRFKFDSNLKGISLNTWTEISKKLSDVGIKLSSHSVANHCNTSIEQLSANIDEIIGKKYPKVKNASVFLGFHEYSDNEIAAWKSRMQDCE